LLNGSVFSVLVVGKSNGGNLSEEVGTCTVYLGELYGVSDEVSDSQDSKINLIVSSQNRNHAVL
jgi:hypothetical protein